jgi:hypothetical protein
VRTTLLSGVLTALLVLSATKAHAQAEAPPAPGGRTHDGFYARLGIGPAFATGSNELEDVDAKADVSGFAVATELAFGGTIAPGLVLGGGSFSMVIPSPKYSAGGTDTDVGTHHVSGVGPFIDYYFDPHAGGHLQAALLLSGIFVQEKDQAESASGGGFGFMVGGGYEFWIAEQWSMGPIARLTYYNDKLEGSDTEVKSTLSLLVPALLFGATYH